MIAVTSSLFCVSAVLIQLDKNADPPAADEQQQLQFLKEQAAAFILYRGDLSRPALPMTPEPVLRYSNPLGGGQAGSGATFLWLDGARPLAAVSLSARPADNRVYLECTSLSAEPLMCLRNGTEFWLPKAIGRAAQWLETA